MPETPNDHKQIPSDVHRTEHASAFRNAFEMEAKMKREEEEKERKRQAAAEEAAYHSREEYAKELTEEKIDLIRLKQGVITESDKVFRAEEPQKQYTLWQKIGNWFYHSKWWLGIAVFVVLVAAFLVGSRINFGAICVFFGFAVGLIRYRRILQFNTLTVKRFQNTYRDSYDAKKLNRYVDKMF